MCALATFASLPQANGTTTRHQSKTVQFVSLFIIKQPDEIPDSKVMANECSTGKIRSACCNINEGKQKHLPEPASLSCFTFGSDEEIGYITSSVINTSGTLQAIPTYIYHS